MNPSIANPLLFEDRTPERLEEAETVQLLNPIGFDPSAALWRDEDLERAA